MSYAPQIRQFLQAHARPSDHAHAQESYTGASHTHYGVTNGAMRDFVKAWFKAERPSYEIWFATLDELYHGESLEEKCITGMILNLSLPYRQQLPLMQLEAWLGELVGWAEVDNTCQSTFSARELQNNWAEWEALLRRLVVSPNINQRRAGLVLLLYPLRSSDDKRFLDLGLEFVDLLKVEKDKLITKAISWFLREGIKQHKSAIAVYLEANATSLPAIAVRETRTKLSTGKK